MLQFKNVSVQGLEIDALTISWQVDPVDPVGFVSSQVEYRIFRSNSPEGPFDLLTATPLVDTFVFTDRQINRRSFWRKHYYKIEAVRTTDSKKIESIVSRAEVHVGAQKRMLVALAIVKKERMLLRGIGITPGFVGTPVAVFIRRTFGQHCSECFDPILQRGLRDNCIPCFNTRYKGGFFAPMSATINLSPNPETLQVVNWGETQPSETDAWMTNYPLLSPGDVIIEDTNRRWKVARYHATKRLRVPVRQILRLVEINRSNVEYKIPVDPALFDRPEYQELLGHNTEFEEIKR